MFPSDRPNHCINSSQRLAKLKDTKDAKKTGQMGESMRNGCLEVAAVNGLDKDEWCATGL